ncbi:YviE [Bacillus freudenreichii]|nr:YviE [Bacillus freudenreichii]
MRVIPQIQIESVKGQIGMRTISARQSIEQPKAVVEIQQPPAEMHIERTPSKLTIDQTKAWEDMNLKSIPKLVEEFAQEGRQQAMEGTARRAEEGDELMRIENGGNPIPGIAKRNSEKPQASFNIKFIPSPFSVKLHYEPSVLDIQWTRREPLIQVEPRKPVIDYEPGKVDIYMERDPSLKIDFINLEV